LPIIDVRQIPVLLSVLIQPLEADLLWNKNLYGIYYILHPYIRPNDIKLWCIFKYHTLISCLWSITDISNFAKLYDIRLQFALYDEGIKVLTAPLEGQNVSYKSVSKEM